MCASSYSDSGTQNKLRKQTINVNESKRSGYPRVQSTYVLRRETPLIYIYGLERLIYSVSRLPVACEEGYGL